MPELTADQAEGSPVKTFLRRIGRFPLSAKGGPARDEAFRRIDGPSSNFRPSSSGAGRKLTDLQRERVGMGKQADWDPRIAQYGIPALLGMLLGGGMGGTGGGLAGALLGAGLGSYLTPENYARLSAFLGGEAGSGVGSSAKPPVAPPVPSQIQPTKELADQALASGNGGLLGQLTGDSTAPEEVYTPEALQAAYKDPRGWLNATVNQWSDPKGGQVDPMAGLGQTIAGIPSVVASLPEMAKGDVGSLINGGASAMWLRSLAKGGKAGLRAAAGDILPYAMAWNTAGDLNNAIGAGLAAPVNPSLPWWQRLAQRANLGMRAVGGTQSRQIFENPSSGPLDTASRAAGLVFNPVANTAALRTKREEASEALARARMSAASSGATHGQDQASRLIRQRLQNTSSAMGESQSWNPLTRLLGGFGSTDPREQQAAAANTARWYGRNIRNMF